MKLVDTLTPEDQKTLEDLETFIPKRIFDIHAHLFDSRHFVRKNLGAYLQGVTKLDLQDYQAALSRWLPGRSVEGLFFGIPNRENRRDEINSWISKEAEGASSNNRALALVSPKDDVASAIRLMEEKRVVGLKPYHLYASEGDTSQARVEDFAPEWMWEVCHRFQGVLMLHLMRDRAIADPENQSAIRQLCLKYPNCRLVLAHVARSFNYRYARKGLSSLVELDNVWVDTSAVTETEAMRAAIEAFGPSRVLFGSDYPISDIRGRCVALHDSFLWAYPRNNVAPDAVMPNSPGTLVGIESLMCIKEACEDTGLRPSDVQGIFRENALRLLAPHLDASEVPETPNGPELWKEAWERISGGTNLLSKRAELHDPQTWPSYFSKCLGSNVWDLSGRRLVDFTGGVGAVLLGYADPDVTRAVKRQLNLGTHCSLCTPDEVELAELLLELHPWAGRVRYARGGGEALAVAVRIARAATGKSGIAFCGYHGWQDWYLAANLGDESSLDGHLLPGLQPLGVPRELKGTSVPFRYNDFASFEAAIAALDGKFAGVVMEPMRSSRPAEDFVAKVAARCRQAGGVFMVDEVTSGWRFGFPGAMNTLDITPDVAVYAKAMSNGIPCAAIIGKTDIMDAANHSFISSTYWTDGVGPAAALASIRKMQASGTQARVSQLGQTLTNHLRELSTKYPQVRMKVDGQPAAPIISFDLGESAQSAKQIVVRRMLERGFLVWATWYIMQTHTEAHVAAATEAMDAALSDLTKLIDAGRLHEEAGPRGGIKAAMGQSFARLA